MVIVSKKRVLLVLSLVVVATLAFTIQIANVKQTVPTVALPVSDKVIVLDAGHRKTR